jgi:hypothetical protein
VRPELETEIAALRRLADAVRDEERNPCGSTVESMRDALRDVDGAQGRKSEWMDADPRAAPSPGEEPR